jgi:hypothetical protein
MLTFTRLVARSYDLDHIDLFWEIEDSTDEVDRWSFFVLRSVDGPAGPFTQIAGPADNLFQLRDPDVNQLHNWRRYFYMIRAVHKDTAEQGEIGPVTLEQEPDLVTLELRRRFNLMLQEFNGIRVVIFPALTSGFRCPTCFDRGSNSRRSTGRQLSQNCPTCFDMTFVGGFGAPISAWMQLDPETKSVQRTDTAERSQTETSARVSAFPPLKPKDMIVDVDNMRWQVERLTSTKKLRAVVHQEPILHAIPKSDVRYRAPINIDLFQRFGPDREYTRPMSLGADVKSPLTNLLDGLLGNQ